MLQGAPEVSVGAAAAALRQQVLASAAVDLPLPGQGETLQRWRHLAQAGYRDLAVAKLIESHHDAIAILEELGPGRAAAEAQTAEGQGPARPRTLWQVWAAEARGQRVTVEPVGAGRDAYRLHGVKPWCSGAMSADAALVTCWPADERDSRVAPGPWLMAVALRQSQVEVQPVTWFNAGMAAAQTASVSFDGAAAMLIADRGRYLSRPGFWHGGGGVAAVWLGGARRLAELFTVRMLGHPTPDQLARAAVGRVDVALHAAHAMARQTAQWIDASPVQSAQAICTALRLCVDDTARTVLDEVETGLGPGPLTQDATLARLSQDLRIFIRQCHAQRDAVSLVGTRSQEDIVAAWAL